MSAFFLSCSLGWWRASVAQRVKAAQHPQGLALTRRRVNTLASAVHAETSACTA
ncbi:MAG: hypothetical protein ACOVO0_14700 [Burkholderiaceae bacterium]